MRFEPPEFTNLNSQIAKERYLFRIPLSSHAIFLYLLFALVLFAAVQYTTNVVPDPYAPIRQVLPVVWLGAVILFLLSVLIFIYNRIEVTNQRIHGYRLSFIPGHRHFAIALTDIDAVHVSQLFCGKRLDYGRITLHTADHRSIHLLYVSKPLTVQTALNKAITQSKAHKKPPHYI